MSTNVWDAVVRSGPRYRCWRDGELVGWVDVMHGRYYAYERDGVAGVGIHVGTFRSLEAAQREFEPQGVNTGGLGG